LQQPDWVVSQTAAMDVTGIDGSRNTGSQVSVMPTLIHPLRLRTI
jgi:hypothetical protein